MKLIQIKDYLLLIHEEAEIRVNNLFYPMDGKGHITRRSSMYLNVDGCGKIIAYRKLSEEAKELDLPLLPPFEEDIDVKKLACNIYDLSLDEYEYIKENLSQNRALIEDHYEDMGREEIPKKYFDVLSFIYGYQAAQSKQFSLEDMINAFDEGTNVGALSESLSGEYDSYEEMENADEYFDESRETFIQSLSTQQLPKEFIPEYEWVSEDYEPPGCDFPDRKEVLKTITNSEGKQELVGVYKY